MLLQGLELPNPRPCATSTLPPVLERPTSPPPLPVEPFEFYEPMDTYGQARVRRRRNDLDIPLPTTTATTTTCTLPVSVTTVPATTLMPPVHDITAVPLPAAEVTVVNVSRTTEWHRKKGVGVPKTPRKGYVCGVCGKHKSSKHFQNILHVASYVFSYEFLIWQKQQATLSTPQDTSRESGFALFRVYLKRSGLLQLKLKKRLLLLLSLPLLSSPLLLQSLVSSLLLLQSLVASPLLLQSLEVTLIR